MVSSRLLVIERSTPCLGACMASKDGKIFDTIVYIGLGVNGLTALYLLLMYFEVI